MYLIHADGGLTPEITPKLHGAMDGVTSDESLAGASGGGIVE